jgi:hypothetical protein
VDKDLYRRLDRRRGKWKGGAKLTAEEVTKLRHLLERVAADSWLAEEANFFLKILPAEEDIAWRDARIRKIRLDRQIKRLEDANSLEALANL